MLNCLGVLGLLLINYCGQGTTPGGW
uniref:Uncharacterized protein n=1 Tax=Arundo donax TaxID=35708 RepID=A0A0A8YXI4_ARUDO